MHSVFEFNGTAYMVMRYEKGESLDLVLDRQKTLDEETLLQTLFPILDGLAAVHEAGFIHRDIKPANIYIREDGSPVLLDFGSARQAVGRSKTLTILIAPGYAPFEQYYSSGDSQGPWTDIYSLGATLYRAIASVPPIDAIERSKGILGSTRDVLVPATLIGKERYSQSFLRAVDHALKFSETERPQSIAQWLNELDPLKPALSAVPTDAPADKIPTTPGQERSPPPNGDPDLPPKNGVIDEKSSNEPLEQRVRSGNFRWLVAALIGIALGFLLSIYYRGPIPDAGDSNLPAELAGREKQLQAVSDQISDKEVRLQTVSEQLSEKGTRLQTVADQLSEGETRLQSVSSQLAKHDERIFIDSERLTGLHTEIEGEALRLSEIQQKRRTALDEQDVAEAELARLNQLIGQLGVERDTLEGEREKTEIASAQTKEQMATLTQDRDQLQADISTLMERKRVLESSTAELRSLSGLESGLKTELSELQDEIARLEKARETEQARVDSVKQEKRALQRDIAALVDEQRDLQVSLANAGEDPPTIEEEIVPTESSIETLAVELETEPTPAEPKDLIRAPRADQE